MNDKNVGENNQMGDVSISKFYFYKKWVFWVAIGLSIILGLIIFNTIPSNDKVVDSDNNAEVIQKSENALNLEKTLLNLTENDTSIKFTHVEVIDEQNAVVACFYLSWLTGTNEQVRSFMNECVPILNELCEGIAQESKAYGYENINVRLKYVDKVNNDNIIFEFEDGNFY